MAYFSPTIAYHSYNHCNWVYPNSRSSIFSLSPHLIFFPSSIHLHRSFRGPPFNSNPLILRSSLGPSSPPPGKEPQRFTGITATFSRLWDTVQIFFAVFIWISLFFWASASNRTNSGRRNKSDRFRK